MNLFEKLNRLDDSLVESKRIVNKKKLTESVEDVNRRKEFLKSVFTVQEIIDLAETHTDFTGKTYKEAFNYVLNNWDNFYFEDEYEAFCEDEFDDDIDEMLTEAELTPWEKLAKTFPDDFGHGSTRPANKTPAQHKTMNDYARDPNTSTYDNSEVTTKPEMSTRDKLLKAFPDLDIRSSKDFLKEDSTKGNTVEELKQFAKYYVKNCPSMLDVWVHNIELKDTAENEFGKLTEEELKVLRSEVFDNLYTLVLTPPDVELKNYYSFFDTSFGVTQDLRNAVARVNKSDAQHNSNYAISNISDILHDKGRDSELENYKKRLTVMTVLQAEELLHKHSAKPIIPAKKKVSKSIEDKQEAKLLPNVKSFIEENLPLLADVEFYNENGTRYPLSHQPKKSPEKYLDDWKQLIQLMKHQLSKSEAKQAAEVLLILDNIPEIIKKELASFK